MTLPTTAVTAAEPGGGLRVFRVVPDLQVLPSGDDGDGGCGSGGCFT